MKVVWTDQAKLRLRDLQSYVAQTAPLVSPEIIRRLILHTYRLRSTPRSGRKVPEYEREDVRELMVRPYRIIYRILPERVDVLTIRHYRQLLPDDLRDL